MWKSTSAIFAGLSVLTATSAHGTIVFQDDFTGGAKPEWSTASTDVTPVGGRHFLGQFGNEVVSLSLSGLPSHMSLGITFDLFVIQSWDGNDTGNGPDEWDMSVDGGSSLLHTTFSNVGPPGDRQAFPGMFQGADHPARTGAAEIDSLGYSFFGDSVYNLSTTFTHTTDSLQLDFSAMGLQEITDESWGIDNVVVQVFGPPEINPANGNAYQFIGDPRLWPDARTAAEALTFMGIPGHVVTFSDAAEEAFVPGRAHLISPSDSPFLLQRPWLRENLLARRRIDAGLLERDVFA